MNNKKLFAKMIKDKQNRNKFSKKIIALSLAIIIAVACFTIIPAITMTDAPDPTIIANNMSLNAVGEPAVLSGSFVGEALDAKWRWNVFSDASTSNIESQFTGTQDDNGKVLVDKSVIYGADDYDAFPADSYRFSNYSVTLSTLAQGYNIYNQVEVDVPLDVVFVLDVSGSMDTYMCGDIYRLEALGMATNNAMKQIIEKNPLNRVGIVVYSSGSDDLLELDHYDTTNASGDFLIPSRYNLSTATGLVNSEGEGVYSSADSLPHLTLSGTYIQHGIARANEMFQRANTKYIDDNGNECSRQPIIMLLSDGEPNFCSENYVSALNGPHHGSPVISAKSLQGVNGYYTILTEKYVKDQVENHYNMDVAFYSVGLGINETGYGETSGYGITGDHYKRTVLNPSIENINYLDQPNSVNNSISGAELFKLIKNTYPNNTITTRGGGNQKFGTTTETVPVIQNPYTISELDEIVDQSYNGDLTVEELSDILTSVADYTIETVDPGLIFKENSLIHFEDTLGTGMEIKSNPVLRYNGTNYTCSSKTTETIDGETISTYFYDYTSTDETTGRIADLSTISVKVITDANEKQTVTYDIPADAMPIVSYDKHTNTYYYESPARLIYQVGLKDDVTSDIDINSTFYTNEWHNGTSAKAELPISENNPYYTDTGAYTNEFVNKAENTSESAAAYLISSRNTENGKVTVSLGNNGMMENAVDRSKLMVSVNKVWCDEENNPIENVSSMPEVTISLYRFLYDEKDSNGNQITDTPTSIPSGTESEYVTRITLNNDNNWENEFPNLLRTKNNDGSFYVYYVVEDSVDGYLTSTSGMVANTDGNIIVTNRRVSLNGSIVAKKKWQDYFGETIKDTSKLPDITAQLWRHVTYTEPQKATVTLVGGSTTQRIDVALGTTITFTVRANFSIILNAVLGNIQCNGSTVNSSLSGSTRTANESYNITGDVTYTYTSNRNVSSWSFSNLNYTVPSPGSIKTGADELVDTATLSFENNWQHEWNNQEITKTASNGNVYYYKYYLVEPTAVDGYEILYSTGNEEGVQGGQLDIINKSTTAMSELPATGGTGIAPYIIGGTLIMLIAAFGLFYKREKFEGGENPSN